MIVTIDGLELPGINAGSVDIEYEDFKTEGGEIIGRHVIATIKGNILIGEECDEETGQMVMSKLKSIRQLGENPGCVFVSIPGFKVLDSKAKVIGVSIDQGPDPAWVNQGSYTLQVKGVAETIPANSLGIESRDCVTQISRNESLQLGEESHGYVFDIDVGASKAFIKFSNSLNLKCEDFCDVANPPRSVLEKLIEIGPAHPKFYQYKSWKQFLQSRSLTVNTDGSFDFNCDIIMVPPSLANSKAIVELEFGYSRTYDTNDITRTTSGSVTGLVSVPWGNIIDLESTCSASKLANALDAYSLIYSKYSNIENWQGYEFELEEKPDCPKQTSTLIGRCEYEPDQAQDKDTECIKPSSGSVAISRTEGTITFNLQWSTTKDENGNECVKDGIRTETTVDITDPQPNFVEHTRPGIGILIQNLKCNSAAKRTITVSSQYPENNGCSTKPQCAAEDGLKIAVEKFIASSKDGFWLMIGNTTTETLNSYTLRQDFIFCIDKSKNKKKK